MKKLICLLLAVCVLLLSACGSKEDPENADATPSPSPTVEPTQTPEPTPEPTPVPVVAFKDYQ